MGGKPHGFGAKPKRPSPLQQVHHSRLLSNLSVPPISSAPPITHPPVAQHPPTSGLVRDPMFWKRFSTAVHASEEVKGDEESGEKPSRSNSVESTLYSNEWLESQRKKARRCKTRCAVITTIVVAVIIAAAVCGWYFINHKPEEQETST